MLIFHGLNDDCDNGHINKIINLIQTNIKDPKTGKPVHAECIDIGGTEAKQVSMTEGLQK